MILEILYLDRTDNFYVLVICKASMIGSMRYLPILLMVFFAVSIVPVYAQNISMDDQEQKIRQEILACEAKIAEDSEMTAAEKTVNQRKCASEIRSLYVENPLTTKTLNENKIKIQNLQRCDDWFSSYKFLDEATFRLQKNNQMVSGCIELYNDPLWEYSNNDRQEVLSEKLHEIMLDIPIQTNLSDSFLNDGIVSDRVLNLEKRVAELENELRNKDMIIKEQMNVIVNLANTLKNVIYNGIQSLYQFA